MAKTPFDPQPCANLVKKKWNNQFLYIEKMWLRRTDNQVYEEISMGDLRHELGILLKTNQINLNVTQVEAVRKELELQLYVKSTRVQRFYKIEKPTNS